MDLKGPIFMFNSKSILSILVAVLSVAVGVLSWAVFGSEESPERPSVVVEPKVIALPDEKKPEEPPPERPAAAEW